MRATVAVAAGSSAFGVLGATPALANISQCQSVASGAVCVESGNSTSGHAVLVSALLPAPLSILVEAGVACYPDLNNLVGVALYVSGVTLVALPVGALPVA